jgi:hypothetical protein
MLEGEDHAHAPEALQFARHKNLVRPTKLSERFLDLDKHRTLKLLVVNAIVADKAFVEIVRDVPADTYALVQLMIDKQTALLEEQPSVGQVPET